MDLDEQELYWTRKRNGLAGEEETERYIRNLEKRIYNLEQIEKEHKKQKCKWLAEFEWICCNGESPYVADNPPIYCKCLSKEDCKYYEEGDDK